jgi:hypothetical protein
MGRRMTSSDRASTRDANAASSIESWLVSAGRECQPGAPLNVPLVPASTFILGNGRAYARDDGMPTWEALEEIVGGLEGGKSVSFDSGMAGNLRRLRSTPLRINHRSVGRMPSTRQRPRGSGSDEGAMDCTTDRCC